MASSVVLKEHTIRRKDLSGDQLASGEVAEIMSRSWVMWGWVKMAGLLRF